MSIKLYFKFSLICTTKIGNVSSTYNHKENQNFKPTLNHRSTIKIIIKVKIHYDKTMVFIQMIYMDHHATGLCHIINQDPKHDT